MSRLPVDSRTGDLPSGNHHIKTFCALLEDVCHTLYGVGMCPGDTGKSCQDAAHVQSL
jgi:hypothetical protein